MSTSHKTVLAGFAGMLTAALLGACATGMSRDECALADWQTIGYEDGLRGFPAERIGAHRVACAKHQVTPNLAAYTGGRERGLREYCQPKNGFRAGLNAPATPTCVRVRPRRLSSMRINGAADSRCTRRAAHDKLAAAQRARRSCTHECCDGQRHCRTRVTDRAYRTPRLARYGTRATDTGAQRTRRRIDQLVAHSQQLAVNVQELERQSPYAL